MEKLKLATIIVSARPGRVGESVAQWVHDHATAHGAFDPLLIDLAEVNLPLLDEPAHPRLKQYQYDHTRRWSATVESADAFVFVLPEYNHGTPPYLVNALDYLYNEWNYKPAAFVSYGGVSGGLRSVVMTKQILNALKMVPIVEAVTIPFVANHRDESGKFNPTEAQQKSATDLLVELHRWAEALKPLRSR